MPDGPDRCAGVGVDGVNATAVVSRVKQALLNRRCGGNAAARLEGPVHAGILVLAAEQIQADHSTAVGIIRAVVKAGTVAHRAAAQGQSIGQNGAMFLAEPVVDFHRADRREDDIVFQHNRRAELHTLGTHLHHPLAFT